MHHSHHLELQPRPVSLGGIQSRGDGDGPASDLVHVERAYAHACITTVDRLHLDVAAFPRWLSRRTGPWTWPLLLRWHATRGMVVRRRRQRNVPRSPLVGQIGARNELRRRRHRLVIRMAQNV